MADSDPRVAAHPLLKIENWRNIAVALRLHGDSVPVAKRRGRGLDVVSFSSMMAEAGAPVWNSKFLIHANG